MPVITTTSLGDTLPVFIAEAELTLKQEGLMKGLVDSVTLGKGAGLTYNRPTWSAVSTIDLTQGVDLSQAQAVTDSNFAVTVAELGGQVFFSDLTEMALREDVMRFFGQALANAYVNAIDTDLTEQLANGGVTLGGATSTMLIGRLMAAVVRLKSATRPTQGTISCVLHPYQYHAVAEDLAALSGGRWINSTGTPSVERSFGSSVNGLSQKIVEEYEVGKLAGVNVYLDPNIAIASSAAKGAVFAKRGIVEVNYESPSVRVQRDESLRGVELNYVGVHGQGVYDSTWVFTMHSDASTPTT